MSNTPRVDKIITDKPTDEDYQDLAELARQLEEEINRIQETHGYCLTCHECISECDCIHLGAVYIDLETGEVVDAPTYKTVAEEMAELRLDQKRLEWLMRMVSGAELRRIKVIYSAGCDRESIDKAMNNYE